MRLLSDYVIFLFFEFDTVDGILCYIFQLHMLNQVCLDSFHVMIKLIYKFELEDLNLRQINQSCVKWGYDTR